MFMCDLTRVISFTFGYGNSAIHFQNVLQDPALAGKYKDTNGNPMNNSSGYHDISHNSGNNPDSAQYIIDKYVCDRTAELLAEMSATPDIGGGSLLDNTLVVFWNECSNGNVHGAVDMPVLLFGGKFLKLKGGSYLQFGGGHPGQVPNGSYSKPAPPYVERSLGHDGAGVGLPHDVVWRPELEYRPVERDLRIRARTASARFVPPSGTSTGGSRPGRGASSRQLFFETRKGLQMSTDP